MTDEKIIDLYFSRSENAITETNKKYGSYCFKIANNILNNREDSEECVNDTWMKTWDSIPPTSPSHLNLYLAKIVRNLSFTRYKSKHAIKRGKGEMAVILDELEECIAGQADIESISNL
jgi:RNA polymerase sigma-70 factor (ECF subfamily)